MKILALLLSIPFCISLVNAQSLQVAGSDAAPFSYEENHEFKGYNFDILKQIEKNSGIKFHYIVYPHARVTSYLDQANPDLIIVFRTVCDKYKETYESQKVFYRMLPTIFLRASIKHPEKKALRIGRLRGTCNELMSKYTKPENIVDLPNLNQALEMIKSYRLDGICALAPLVHFSLKNNKDFKIKLANYKIQSDTSHFDAVLCRKKSLSIEIKKNLDAAALKVHVPIF